MTIVRTKLTTDIELNVQASGANITITSANWMLTLTSEQSIALCDALRAVTQNIEVTV